jgi:hypothetical protein
VLLLARVGLSALLVQLALLLLGVQTSLSKVFRGALWAQAATWLGTAAQVVWISTLPPASISTATLEAPPGTLASFFPVQHDVSVPLTILLHQVTLFDLAWIILFATAIEDGQALRARIAFVAVGLTWLAFAAVRWAALLYLSGLA